MADWNEVLAAVGTALGGDTVEGKRVLTASWDNTGDGYLRRGQVELAGEHWEAGTSHCPDLPEDGYGAMIRNGLDNLGKRISGARDRETPGGVSRAVP